MNNVTQFALFTKGGLPMLGWLFRLLSRVKSSKSFVSKTTYQFKEFAKSNYANQKKGLTWEGHESLLCRYALETRRSPYEDDKDFMKVKALLVRNGIHLDWIKFHCQK